MKNPKKVDAFVLEGSWVHSTKKSILRFYWVGYRNEKISEYDYGIKPMKSAGIREKPRWGYGRGEGPNSPRCPFLSMLPTLALRKAERAKGYGPLL